MRPSDIFASLCTFFLPPALIATALLYCYAPLFNCSFPVAKRGEAGCSIPGQQRDAIPTEIAPFRLLALADPQLEGDTSLPDLDDHVFPSLEKLWTSVRSGGFASLPSDLSIAGRELVTEDLYNILQSVRKRLDLWGNDLYLAHLYRSVSWWSDPTHTVVLGDLLGSQHISDAEFQRRSRRFWKKVFRGGKKVPRSITDVSGRSEILGKDKAWKNRVIAVAGNHDIGYAGDITEHRIQRFEETYGSVNWEVHFRLDNGTLQSTPSSPFDAFQLASSPPDIHVVVLNSMNLDSPAKNEELQAQSRDFASRELHGLQNARRENAATVLLTHIPLYKEDGICADGEFFDWLPPHEGPGIKEQNHLSQATSHHILDGLSRSGKAIILNGHDHEGCKTYHYRPRTQSPNSTENQWNTKPYAFSGAELENDDLVGIREITVRSMMGSYSGNAGFLSGWFDHDEQEWHFQYNNCYLGVQHIWWVVHIFDLVIVGFGVAAVASAYWEVKSDEAAARRARGEVKKTQ